MNLKILTVESDIQISQRTDTYLYLIQLIFFMKNMNYVSEYLLLSNQANSAKFWYDYLHKNDTLLKILENPN